MARRAHSQVFLHDRGVINRFVSALPAPSGKPVLEIGPGSGAITHSLLAAGHRVVAVEIDPCLAKGLADLGHAVDVRIGSILGFQPRDLIPPPVVVVGALPYHLSGLILRWLADWADDIATAAVILQGEVVERMGAPPGHRARGLLSIIVQSVFDVTPLFRIGSGAFVPRPKVESRAVLLTRRTDGRTVASWASQWSVARGLFQHRRKMIRGIIEHRWGEHAARRAAEAGIDLTLRPERLSFLDLETLTTALMPGA
ncbi:hypothetical protein JXA88_01680 [Candidatus Fermentibacteria bacterium]|nr:hypothetical protein [Candidatus Fermentibacteria bacterium]